MDPIYLLVLGSLILLATWIIGINMQKHTNFSILCWLLCSIIMPFFLTIVWAAIRVYFNPELTTEIPNFYQAVIVGPIIDHFPKILLSVFLGTVLGIIVTALTRSNSPSQKRYDNRRRGAIRRGLTI